EPESLTPEHATQLATRILTHPLLSRSGEKLAGVVQREELICVILEIASGAAGAAPVIFPTAEQALAATLSRLGVAQPGATLNALRLLSMRLEGSLPHVAPHVRESMAVITEADSLFVARITGSFDPTM